MANPEALLRVYEELAHRYGRQGEPRNRDHCLVLAADAALAAGRPDEADRLRLRLLQVNPHHLLRPFASMEEAMESADVKDYVADLRAQWPPDTAEKLLHGQREKGGAAPTEPIFPLMPPASPPQIQARPIIPPERKPTPAPPPSTRQTASPFAKTTALRTEAADQPTRTGRFLADLFFLLGLLIAATVCWFAFGGPFLE